MNTPATLLAAMTLGFTAQAGTLRRRELAPPVVQGKWLVPARDKPSLPVWGIRGGIAVGLWPSPGPRGLIRIYAPFLGQQPLRMINFIAVEPVVGRARGLSELEHSALDNTRGKAMWAGDEIELAPKPRNPARPAKGRIVALDGGAEALTFVVFLERFANGAQPIVQVILREDRPREVSFKLFAAAGSAKMASCVLTATMGNYARLRHLWLKGEVVESTRLWPQPRPGSAGFTRHRQWGLDRMLVARGQAIVAATPNEPDPERAAYADDVRPHWRYRGRAATQYWRAPAEPGLVVRVNGRTTYWASRSEIPGGISYENFELAAPFSNGQMFTFGVTPAAPEALGFRAAWRRNLTNGR